MRKSILNSETKKDIKKKNIFAAATKVFSIKGYKDTSIKDIADEAAVSVGSFYFYFRNKEDIIEQLYDEIADMSIKIANSVSMKENDNVVKKFTSAMTITICVYLKNKELSRILLLKCTGINETFEKKRWEILDKVNEYLEGVLVHLKTAHAVDISNVNVFSISLTYSIFGIITSLLQERITIELEDVIFNLTTYHLRALKILFTDIEVKQYINDMLTLSNKESLKMC